MICPKNLRELLVRIDPKISNGEEKYYIDDVKRDLVEHMGHCPECKQSYVKYIIELTLSDLYRSEVIQGSCWGSRETALKILEDKLDYSLLNIRPFDSVK